MKKTILALVAMSLAVPAFGMTARPERSAISQTDRQVATSIYVEASTRIRSVSTPDERAVPEVMQAMADMRDAYNETQATNDRRAFDLAKGRISRAGVDACQHIAGC